ncbi:MAG: ABC transporter substrate-binding protein [Alphaproteobacteria bacterium]|nr:ABC transporter substrate-binding protein [Alphaproteobacteria bacterium]
MKIKSFLFVNLLLIFAGVKAFALESIALYGNPKYQGNWSSFEYANPDAPKGGRVVLPAYGTFDNFNPFIFKGIAATQAAELTLDSLAYVPADDISVAYPLLAKSFELTKDYVGFFLDERAKFSNGEPVLADDVIFSFNSLIEKGAPLYKIYYADVKKVEKMGDRHVRFWFNPDSQNKELPLIISQIKIFSQKDWNDYDFAAPALRPFVGSGPYILKDFSPNNYLIFKRNPNYWAKDIPSRRGFYNFDEIRYDYYQDTTVTLQALFAGNIDLREEYIAKIWVTGYDNELVANSQIIKEDIKHNNTARLQNFGFNLRREKFADKRVREAIDWAFNYEWAGENLFYNQYQRLFSYFSNSGMEAKGLPQGRELEILEKYRNELPATVFEKAPQNPVYKDIKSSRDNLRHAVWLLNQAGYDFIDGKMTNLATREPLKIEILGNAANGSSFTRVMLPFINNLAKIGIEAKFRNLEVNVFKNRLDNFDFDMAILSFPISSLPGNEQKEFWGSQSADIKGSSNLLGIKNPVIDKLLNGLISAQEKQDYIAHVQALDRVLLDGHYMIMQWYSPVERIAYRNRFEHLKTELKTGFLFDTWWIKEDK